MRVLSTDTDADGITTVVMDFSDEAIEGAPGERCVATAKVSGDHRVYLQSLADDFRTNNAHLFPRPAVAMPEPGGMEP